jgi:hypothetical protein
MTVDIGKAFPDHPRHLLEDLGVFRFTRCARVALMPVKEKPGPDEYVFHNGSYWLGPDAQSNRFHEWRYEFKVGAPGQPAEILTLVLHENRRDVDTCSSADVVLLKRPPESAWGPKGTAPRQFRR